MSALNALDCTAEVLPTALNVDNIVRGLLTSAKLGSVLLLYRERL
jgi:hypothetical protein